MKISYKKILCGLILGTCIMLAGNSIVYAEELAEPTSEPTAIPTTEPTTEPTAEPTTEPTLAPTATPTIEPTATPIASPDVSIKLNKYSYQLYKGEVGTLSLEGVTNKVEWQSSDTSIATVTSKGKVRGIASGKVDITAICNGITYTCKVTVKNKGIDNVDYTMEQGEVLRLHIDGEEDISWTSSNKKIATVKDGKVKAIKKGAVTIRAITDEHTYTCEVKINKRTKSVIYLTFDDGPTLTSTPKVLDILKKNNVKATFFVIGMDSTKEGLIKREAKEGHTVAIHGANHDYGKIYKSTKSYMNNIMTEQKLLKKVIGKNVWVTRFPGGSSNLVSRHYSKGIMTKLVKKVDKAGFAYFDWNVSSGDAGGAYNSAQVYSNVTKGLRKNRDNVVLMHDFANNNKTIDALDKIIKYGKSHGYEFRAISPSTVEVHHGVQN